jgi:hypothetical protein
MFRITQPSDRVFRRVAIVTLCVVLATLSEPHREEIDQLRRRLGGDLPGLAIRLGPLEREPIVAYLNGAPQARRFLAAANRCVAVRFTYSRATPGVLCPESAITPCSVSSASTGRVYEVNNQCRWKLAG